MNRYATLAALSIAAARVVWVNDTTNAEGRNVQADYLAALAQCGPIRETHVQTDESKSGAR